MFKWLLDKSDKKDEDKKKANSKTSVANPKQASGDVRNSETDKNSELWSWVASTVIPTVIAGGSALAAAHFFKDSTDESDNWKEDINSSLKLSLTNRILGRGSHKTVVFEGSLIGDGRKVAVKRMLKTFSELAKKERELLIELDEVTQYVVHYYTKEEDKEYVYLALELCDRTLEEQVQLWKQSQQVSSSCRIQILRQIIFGLKDLHRYGVVHRDLTPQNILVLEPKKHIANERLPHMQYQMKIADFSSAMKLGKEISQSYITDGDNGSKQTEGSCGWRAAEVVNKKKQNKSLDIFAAGCIFYFVLTGGKHPFGDSAYEREFKICKGRYSLTELEILQLWDAKDLIERMIRSNPCLRPAAEQVLEHPLFWSDAKKLSFIAESSDRLLSLKGGIRSRENKEFRAYFEKHFLKLLNSTDSYNSQVLWASEIDSWVLKAVLNRRKYNATSAVDLLRFIRNTRSHYHQLPASVQQTLGVLPRDDQDEKLNHNVWQYFHRRFPKLLITVYLFFQAM